jgi:hypothetical protein
MRNLRIAVKRGQRALAACRLCKRTLLELASGAHAICVTTKKGESHIVSLIEAIEKNSTFASL